MQEPDLRRRHRRLGIILALFIIIQAGTGLLLSLEKFLSLGMEGPAVEFMEFLALLHRGGGDLPRLYRVLLGLGLTGMAVSGSLIYFKIRARSRKK